MNTALATAAEDWALALTAQPSVNGTAGEAAFASWLAALLDREPAFERVWRIEVRGDALGRAAVAALARGRGAETLLLTGHFDTVRVDDYGELAPLALRPRELRPALVSRLAGRTGGPAEASALADLRGGDFLPGRGLLDMKSGLGAGLAAVQVWAEDPERAGNLLFLAVPDEEANSAGARAAVQALPDQLAALGLSLVGAINLDALLAVGDGAAGRCVTLGTVGKLLPSALVVGRPTHAADTLAGVSAGALAAALVSEVEWAPELTDREGPETAAPPTVLGLSDHRPGYDVTTAERVWAYWNVMILGRRPEAVLEAMAALSQRAMARALAELRQRGGRMLPETVPVLTFAELRRQAGPGPTLELPDGLDLPERCRLLTEALWRRSGRTGPAVVLGFASMPYLPARLQGEAGARLEAAVRRAAAEVGARHGATIGCRGHFPAISDMSFLGQVDSSQVPAIAANTPSWGSGIDAPGALGVPAVNIGPWGRDYHTPLERVHTPYAFGVLPDLLLTTAREMLR